MIVGDTSVAVAAALPWHASHAAALAALPQRPTRLIAHVGLETYSVLTRLPPPHRVAALDAHAYLAATFERPAFTLSADGYAHLLDVAAHARIGGGAVYDALVALTAREAGATLLTLDRRAVATYRLLLVAHELVE